MNAPQEWADTQSDVRIDRRKDGLYRSERHFALDAQYPRDEGVRIRWAKLASYPACRNGPCRQSRGGLCPSPDACRLPEPRSFLERFRAWLLA
jgi:hypothetical protein